MPKHEFAPIKSPECQKTRQLAGKSQLKYHPFKTKGSLVPKEEQQKRDLEKQEALKISKTLDEQLRNHAQTCPSCDEWLWEYNPYFYGAVVDSDWWPRAKGAKPLSQAPSKAEQQPIDPRHHARTVGESLGGLEKKILIALRHTLKDGVVNESALQDMLDAVDHGVDETSHHSQFRWEGIDDAFKLKVAGSPFEDAITSSFFQTHSYKYLDDPAFKLSFERELRQKAVPEKEIGTSINHLESLISDLKTNPSEQDAGWNPNMADLVDLTSNADNRTPKQEDPFTGGGHYPSNDSYDKGNLEGF